MGALLTALDINEAAQKNLSADVFDAETLITGLINIYQKLPSNNNKKEILATTIAETTRMMLLKVRQELEAPNQSIPKKQNIIQSYVSNTPPSTAITHTPPITPPSPIRPPKPPKPQNNVPVRVTCSPTFCEGDDTNLGIIEEIWQRPNGTYQYLINGTYYKESLVLPAQTTNDTQAILDALEDELNEIQEAIVVFDTDEPEYQELNNRIIEIQNEINTLTR